jgi:hypothetical protein
VGRDRQKCDREAAVAIRRLNSHERRHDSDARYTGSVGNDLVQLMKGVGGAGGGLPAAIAAMSSSNQLRTARAWLLMLTVAVAASSCTIYDPLAEQSLRQQFGQPVNDGRAISVEFLGTSTLVIEDGRTTLVVDGFLSRPSLLRTIFGGLRPSADVIHAELTASGVHRVDAVLVGHAHHDHALDSTAIADLFGAEAFGSASFATSTGHLMLKEARADSLKFRKTV